MIQQKICNVFSEEELQTLKESINKTAKKHDTVLGRYISQITISKNIEKKIQNIANAYLHGYWNTFTNPNIDFISYSGTTYANYNNKVGKPNLPPHLDHDTNDIIINYQLSGNINWQIGLDNKLYTLEDNTALIFNGNKLIHWRPHKIFKNDDYLEMLFFRFGNVKNPSDYSHLDVLLTDDMFKETNLFRDSLGNT